MKDIECKCGPRPGCGSPALWPWGPEPPLFHTNSENEDEPSVLEVPVMVMNDTGEQVGTDYGVLPVSAR